MNLSDATIRATCFTLAVILGDEGITIAQYKLLMTVYYRRACGATINGRSYEEQFKTLRSNRLLIFMAGTRMMKLTDLGHELLNRIHERVAVHLGEARKQDFTDLKV